MDLGVSNSSTENTSYKLINDILLALNNKLTNGGIFCDLEQDFVCVNHNIFLSKLEFCEMVGKFNALLQSYHKDIRER
jgi:hypothetical protein